ncbi:hypothetical protein M9H77_14547 [Catharanthus roseus]|uniref:Uncharacterized protein n=1 Tax=Catharanthus roseus TaxID=4058 RepID=A0ACC0BNH4_CATRO|nr:hypothetical protein M9H77_14547 [Catharanthus roseus]
MIHIYLQTVLKLRGNDHAYWGTQHAIHVEAWYQWRLRVRDGSTLAVETSMLQEVDDMTSVVIQEPPSSPSQMAVFAKKVQMIIWRCMVSIGDTLGYTPSQHDIQQTFLVQPSRRSPREQVPDRGARGVKRSARRQPSHGAGGGCPPVPPFPCRSGQVDPGHVEMERGEGSGQVERSEGSGGGHPYFGFDATFRVTSRWIRDIARASPSRFRVCPISVASRYIFRVFIVSYTSSSRHSRFIYTASAYIVGIFI